MIGDRGTNFICETCSYQILRDDVSGSCCERDKNCNDEDYECCENGNNWEGNCFVNYAIKQGKLIETESTMINNLCYRSKQLGIEEGKRIGREEARLEREGKTAINDTCSECLQKGYLRAISEAIEKVKSLEEPDLEDSIKPPMFFIAKQLVLAELEKMKEGKSNADKL